jgi:hypothetical protein
MRILLAILFSTVWINLCGQTVYSSDEIVDCELLTLRTVNKLSDDFSYYQLDSLDLVINDWINQCGISECTQRLIILKNIMEGKPSAASIQTYFENYFHRILRNRIRDSRRIDYGYAYTGSKAYFGFVPLRHKIDSIVMEESVNLINTNSLNPDEKLICIIFSGDIEGFDKEIKKPEYNDGIIKQYMLEKIRDNGNGWLTYTLYTGFYKPLSSSDIFAYSPIVGVTFSSPLRNKLIVELGIKFRININDKSFNYYALGDTNNVNSDVSVFFGGLIGYKIYESKKLVLVPKFGIGLESVDTGISEKESKNEDETYYNIETIHLSLGLSAMTPVFRKSYIGVGINYHYCPYNTDHDLLTEFSNHLISTELFLRF